MVRLTFIDVTTQYEHQGCRRNGDPFFSCRNFQGNSVGIYEDSVGMGMKILSHSNPELNRYYFFL